MLPFLLYLVTGLVTGFHIWTLLSLALYGVPVDPLELVALLGSFCLLIAAYLSLYRPYIAARLALLASLAVWSFYGPAIATLVRTNLAAPRAVASDSIRPSRQHVAGWTGQHLSPEFDERFGAN